jgi:hypothetical protein
MVYVGYQEGGFPTLQKWRCSKHQKQRKTSTFVKQKNLRRCLTHCNDSFGVEIWHLGHQDGIFSQPEKHKDDLRETQPRKMSTISNQKVPLSWGSLRCMKRRKRCCVSVIGQSKDWWCLVIALYCRLVKLAGFIRLCVEFRHLHGISPNHFRLTILS